MPGKLSNKVQNVNNTGRIYKLTDLGMDIRHPCVLSMTSRPGRLPDLEAQGLVEDRGGGRNSCPELGV